MDMEDENALLRANVGALNQYIKRARQEIVRLSDPDGQRSPFETMDVRLDAILHAMNAANEAIMSAVDKNDEILGMLRERTTDNRQLALLDQIADYGTEIMDACSFHRATGEQACKVAKSLTYVENRINHVADALGREKLGPDLSEDERDEIEALFD